MITWLDPKSAQDSKHEYLDTITIYNPRSSNKHYCYGKSQVRKTKDFLFVDLHKELYSLTSRFLRVSCRYL